MHCPHCNNEDQSNPCQNKFGNNAYLLGGTAGMCDGMGMATEHQNESTPHGHGLVSLVTPYQHRHSGEILALLEAGKLSVESVKRYSEHLHCEDHVDHDAHQAALPELEAAWKTNYAGLEHLGLCAKPSYLGSDEVAIAWTRADFKEGDFQDQEDFLARVKADADKFREAFEKDVQYVYSRVQHHWHELRDGKRVRVNHGKVTV